MRQKKCTNDLNLLGLSWAPLLPHVQKSSCLRPLYPQSCLCRHKFEIFVVKQGSKFVKPCGLYPWTRSADVTRFKKNKADEIRGYHPLFRKKGGVTQFGPRRNSHWERLTNIVLDARASQFLDKLLIYLVKLLDAL